MSQHCMFPVRNVQTGEFRFCRRDAETNDLQELRLCRHHANRVVEIVRQRDQAIAATRRFAEFMEDHTQARQEIDARRVYYVRRPDGAIKIGVSGNLKQRLQTLRNVSPIELLATHGGSFEAEFALHRRFAEHRLDGEWFAPADELLAHIALVNEMRVAGAAA